MNEHEAGIYGRISSQLEALSAELSKRNSMRHTFLTGIVYGLGFFLGSAVIAAILFGIIGSVLRFVPGVGDTLRGTIPTTTQEL